MKSIKYELIIIFALMIMIIVLSSCSVQFGSTTGSSHKNTTNKQRVEKHSWRSGCTASSSYYYPNRKAKK